MEYNEKTYKLNYADCCINDTSDIRELSEWADVIILNYDVSSRKSLVYCQVLYSQIRRFHLQKMNKKTLFLIGCKSDLQHEIDQGNLSHFRTKKYHVETDNLDNFATKFAMSDVISCQWDSNETILKLKNRLIWKHITSDHDRNANALSDPRW